MKLIVTDKQTIAEDTVSVRLEAVSGPLEAVAPGAHVTLEVNGLTRRYTLTRGHNAGDPYEIQVLRSKDSHGGSQWIHDDLAVGDALEGLGVANDFPLSAVPAPSVFIAGGIGITPFLSMAEAVAAAGRAFEVHHSLLNILFIVIAYSVYNSYYACYEDHNRLGSQESVWRSDGSCTTPACQHHPKRPTLGGGDFG
jgi:ferredoxin-NADP reductase